MERIVQYAGEHSEEERQELRERLRGVLSERGPVDLDELGAQLLRTGADFAYYPKNELARLIHGAVAELAVTRESSILHPERLAALRDGPAVFLSNHLSYSDANLFVILLERAGYRDIADRLTVIAGPKVYSDPMRRFASLCFGTIKTPQSSTRSSDEAVMSPREVARLALETIEIARERQRAGDALLLFVEGTRSRTASMQRALPAVARYLEDPESLLVPVGVTGSERFIPVGEERLHPTLVHFQIGHAAKAGALAERCDGNRRLTMDAIGVAIARLLPPEYRGIYGEASASEPDLREAFVAADSVFSGA